MSATRCYLDFNATAPIRVRAKAACMAALDSVGNPSSVHAEGRAARSIVETARSSVGRLVGAPGDRVVFTSGGTEAANLLLSPGSLRGRKPEPTRLLVAATEHAAVLQGHRFPAERTTILSVGRDGVIDLDHLDRALAADGGAPALLALQLANNETGVIQPVRAAADRVHAAGGLVVCDAVQAPGRIPLSFAETGADAALVSGHKLGAPKGVGAAILAADIRIATAQIRGGGQERGLRSGTENVPGIAGFGAAADEVDDRDGHRLGGLQSAVEAGLRAIHDGVVVFGANARRLSNTTCFAVPGVAAETLLMSFDLAGIALSSGSACASGKVARSHVLDAMGVERPLAAGALRISFGWSSSMADVERVLDAFASIMRHLQRRPAPVAA